MLKIKMNNTSSVQKVNAKVEIYENSTLVETCTCNDRLQDFTVERIGVKNKFFGFGIIHKITAVFIDLDRTLTITKNTSLKAYFGYDEFVSPYPTFYVAEATRDETTNAITVVAYDKLYAANEHTVSEITAPYTLHQFVAAAIPLLGVTDVVFEGIYDNIFEINYPSGGNFEGTENYREALNAAAEVTQTVYFLNSSEQLVFKRLSRDGNPVATITKEDYYELESGETRVLAAITSTNELGNDISVEVDGVTGVVQFVRDNPFWELREDIETLLTRAATAIGGIAATPFYCDWDGNFLLQIGDKIALVAEDNTTITSYLLYDTIRYDGILAEATQFVHDGVDETAANPLSLGEALKQTYAKVDKQNKTIELVASETASNSANIASMKIDVDGIKLAIESLEDATLGDFTDLTKRIAALELSDTEIKASVTETKELVESVETDITTLETELGVVETNVGTLTSNVAENTANVGELLTDVAANATNITNLTGTVETHSTKIGELTTTTESITGRVSSVETTTTNLVNKTGVMETDLKALDTNLGTVTATVAENKTAIGELTVTTEAIGLSVSDITERTTELEGITEDLDGAVAAQNTTITEHTSKIGELEVSTEAIIGRVSTVETTTTNLTSDVSALDGAVDDINAELTTINASITTNSTKIGELEVSTEAISAQVSSVETTTTTLTTTTNNLQSDLNDLDSFVGGLDEELGELVTELGTVSATVTTHTEQIGALDVTTDNILASVSTLETTTSSLSESIDTLGENVQTNNQTITNHTEKIAALELTDSSLTASVSSLESTTSTLTTSLQDLEGVVTDQGTQITTNEEQIAALQMTDNEITVSVSSLQETTQTQIDGLEESYNSLAEEVSVKITKDDLTIAIEEERRNGAERVRTSTGYTFSDDGLDITRSDSELSSKINHEGLVVYKYDEEVLTANKDGVNAKDLHARTYLKIGRNTYFSDFNSATGESRAGCFWNGD